MGWPMRHLCGRLSKARAAALLVVSVLCLTGCDGGCGGCDTVRKQADRAAERARSADVQAMKEKAARAAEIAKRGASVAKDIGIWLKVPERIQSGRNLRRISVAIRAYHDAHGCFPPAASRDTAGRPLLSWRVLILPYLGPEDAALFREFKLDEPWDSDHNRRLLPRMPKIYAAPSVDLASTRPTSAPATTPSGAEPSPFPSAGDYAAASVARAKSDAAGGLTYYKVFTGPGTVFEEGRRVALKDINDGPFFTFLVVEAREPSPWTKPEDLVYDPQARLPSLGFFEVAYLAVDCAGVVLYHDPDVTYREYVTIAGGETPPPSSGSGGGHVFDFD